MHIHQRIFTTIILVVCLIGIGVSAGCTSTGKSSVPVTSAAGGPVEKVEVIHFHSDEQCTSCIAVGELAEAIKK
jgi:hypothetical protein